MGKHSRRKGADGEREVFALLREQLGDDSIQRNQHQAREGGSDCAVLVGGMALEVKRWGKRSFLMDAIEQAEAQAVEVNGVPCVVFRMDGGQWRFMPVLDAGQFCQLVREGTCEQMNTGD